jgi:hypothetical protein
VIQLTAFSEDLIARIKERYSDNSDGLHEALLDPNPANSLYWLDQYAAVNLSASHVVEMIEQGRVKDLLAEAQDIRLREGLLAEAYEQARKVPHPWRLQVDSTRCPTNGDLFDPTDPDDVAAIR